MLEQSLSFGTDPSALAQILTSLGGLALFLLGLDQLSDALKALAGERLRNFLRKLTKNPLSGVFTGAAATAVIQSSSVTTVLVVGFVSAGILTMTQAVGVIMGANIGTTLTAQIIAFRVTDLSLLLLAIGVALKLFGRSDQIRWYGTGVLGLGMLFLGMTLMGTAMAPFRDTPGFQELMVRMESPLFGILVGTAFTAIVQSSSATTGIVLVLAGQGLVSLEGGIALILGANIGTCVTAMLGAAGKSREAVRAAIVHVLFNMAGVLLWLPMIPLLAAWAVGISPSAEALSGVARMAQEGPRQIANAHMIFNVGNTLIFLPFAAFFAKTVAWLIPERELEPSESGKPRFLDEELLKAPALALDRARLEVLRLGDRVREMLERSLLEVLHGSHLALDQLRAMDNDVDDLYREILAYLRKISQEGLSEPETTRLLQLMEVANSLENIGDLIETNLVSSGHSRLESNLAVGPTTSEFLTELHAVVLGTLDLALTGLSDENEEVARQVIQMKPEVQRLSASAAIHQARRLAAQEPNRLPAYTIEMDVLETFKRIYYFCKRIARALLTDREVEVEG